MNALRRAWAALKRYAHSDDPLVEAANWVAFSIGSHLPLWPLYIWWAAGRQAWPSSILTVAFTPMFLLVPPLAQRRPLAGRIMLLVFSIGNTAYTRWVLGPQTGTELFLIPCAVLAAMVFRRSERWLMLLFTSIPVVVWYVARDYSGGGLHHYSPEATRGIFTLNVLSVSVLVIAFGWLLGDVYQRMEQRAGAGSTS